MESAKDSGTTCGPLYKSGLEAFTGMDADMVPIFAAGFVSGQAEKIHLGACQAAMFRPAEEWRGAIEHIVFDVQQRYGLHSCRLDTANGREVWLCASPAVQESIRELGTFTENSVEWHERRGLLCGVPQHRIDHAFHDRRGFGERCDG